MGVSGVVLSQVPARDKASGQTQKPCAPGRPRPSAFPQGQLVVSLAGVCEYVLARKLPARGQSVSSPAQPSVLGHSSDIRWDAPGTPCCRAGT